MGCYHIGKLDGNRFSEALSVDELTLTNFYSREFTMGTSEPTPLIYLLAT